jgi:phytoene synthase
LSYCADEVRRGDPDRFLTALFAPRDAREAVFALLAFNLELARVAESVRQPALGDIRLQWWREALDGIYGGTPRAHPVIEALTTAVRERGLPRPVLDAMIDARGADLDDEPPESLDALQAYAAQTSGGLAVLIAHALAVGRDLGPPAREACEQVGTAWALTGLMRAIPFHAARGRVFLPRDLLEQEGVGEREVIEGRRSPGLLRVIGAVVADAEARLKAARAHRGAATRPILPALLPASLSDLYLRILQRPDYDPFRTDTRIPTSRLQLRLMRKAVMGRY